MINTKSILFVLTLCAILFGTHVYAQNCHLDRDEKDPFTGEHVKMYKHLLTNQGTLWWIQLEQKATQYSITIAPVIGGRTMLVATTGTKLMVKLEDGTILPLLLTKDVQPSFTRDGYTRWILKMDITEEELKKLAMSPITDIRTTIDTREINFLDIKSKHSDKIMRAAICILQKG